MPVYCGINIHRFAEEHKIPVVYFKKGKNKEETARPYLEAAAQEGQERVVLIGIAQEKASAWRSWKGKGQETASHPHMEWGRQMAYVNHFYFYLWDAEWGRSCWFFFQLVAQSIPPTSLANCAASTHGTNW